MVTKVNYKFDAIMERTKRKNWTTKEQVL